MYGISQVQQMLYNVDAETVHEIRLDFVIYISIEWNSNINNEQ